MLPCPVIASGKGYRQGHSQGTKRGVPTTLWRSEVSPGGVKGAEQHTCTVYVRNIDEAGGRE